MAGVVEGVVNDLVMLLLLIVAVVAVVVGAIHVVAVFLGMFCWWPLSSGDGKIVVLVFLSPLPKVASEGRGQPSYATHLCRARMHPA